ncbi:MAG: triphosphoribosyl-dephospho-CoA synthase, partial [Gammaproteobacteria bacterium]
RYDVIAFKPGNVSIDMAGHCMSARDFLMSARVAAGPATDMTRGLGDSIRAAVEATLDAVRCNTNLGILLLCVPLLRACQIPHPSRCLIERLEVILTASDVADARAVYRAIRLANPAGLGVSPEQDVATDPTLPLLDVMRLAAARDTIAAQYATGFREILSLGTDTLRRARNEAHSLADAAVTCFLEFLRSAPDTHIIRKYGGVRGASVQRRAQAVASALKACQDPRGRATILAVFDNELKSEDVNPGTCADLTVASLLALILDAALKARD